MQECRISCQFKSNYIVQVMKTIRTSEVTLDPKSQPAPRGLTAHVSMSSGSLHIRSQNGPSCGISQFRSMTLIWSVSFHSESSPRQAADYGTRTNALITLRKRWQPTIIWSEFLYWPTFLVAICIRYPNTIFGSIHSVQWASKLKPHQSWGRGGKKQIRRNFHSFLHGPWPYLANNY